MRCFDALSVTAIPQTIQQKLTLAESSFKARKIRKARDLWDAVLRMEPHNPVALRGRARALWDAERWSEAAAAYRVSWC